jgi:hypothetical protein
MRSGTVVVDTVAVRPVGKLAAHLLLPSLKFRCVVNVEKLDGERKGIVDVWAPVVKANLYLLLLRYLRSRQKPGVARHCSVMVEISFHLGCGLFWTGQKDPYTIITNTTTRICSSSYS